MLNFHGNFTRVRGRKMTPLPISAPNSLSTFTRTYELTCQGFVTKSSSIADHK
jgi:hypothetical protein